MNNTTSDTARCPGAAELTRTLVADYHAAVKRLAEVNAMSAGSHDSDLWRDLAYFAMADAKKRLLHAAIGWYHRPGAYIPIDREEGYEKPSGFIVDGMLYLAHRDEDADIDNIELAIVPMASVVNLDAAGPVQDLAQRQGPEPAEDDDEEDDDEPTPAPTPPPVPELTEGQKRILSISASMGENFAIRRLMLGSEPSEGSDEPRDPGRQAVPFEVCSATGTHYYSGRPADDLEGVIRDELIALRRGEPDTYPHYDRTIWYAGKALAIVRLGPDGEPEVIRLDRIEVARPGPADA